MTYLIASIAVFFISKNFEGFLNVHLNTLVLRQNARLKTTFDIDHPPMTTTSTITTTKGKWINKTKYMVINGSQTLWSRSREKKIIIEVLAHAS